MTLKTLDIGRVKKINCNGRRLIEEILTLENKYRIAKF